MSKITIKDGHLWKGGEKLQLEFGNREQIKAIQDYSRLIEQFREGVTPECTYAVTGYARIMCICENMILLETDAHHEDDIECFDTLTRQCHRCKRKYEFAVKRHWKRDSQGRAYQYGENLVVTLQENDKKN